LSFFVLIGFKNNIKTKLFAQTAHLQVNKFTANRSFEEATMPNNLALEQNVKINPKIKSINKVALKSVILKTKTSIEGVVFKGVDSLFDWSLFKQNLVQGRLPSGKKNANEVIISKKTAEMLETKLDEGVLVYFIQNPPRARKVKIVGIYDSGIEEFDQIYVYGGLDLVQTINGWDKGQFGHFEVNLKDLNDLGATKNDLLKTFPQEYEVKTVKDLMPQFYDWFNLLDRNIILVIVLIIIVAGFNISSVLLIMIMERTPMVGLLKSLGAKQTQIFGIYFLNTLKICIWGLVWGNILAFSLAYFQDKTHFVKLDAESYYMSHVPIEWNYEIVLLVNLGVIGCIMLISIFPIFLTKKIKIIEALKYKD
jgi:lipoprotein-releasing system permease protein